MKTDLSKLYTVEFEPNTDGYPWHIDTLDQYVRRHRKFVIEGRTDPWLLLAVVDSHKEARIIANELRETLTPGLADLNKRGISYMDALASQMELESVS